MCINPASLPIAIELCEGTDTKICVVCDFPFGLSTTVSKVKVIFETDALTLDEVKKATETAIAAGADFVKTSTGFFTGGKNEGATYEVIQAMMDTAQGRCKIKGSGCIRTREHFLKLIDMGIDRMGIGYRSTPVVLNCTPEEAKAMREGKA